MTAAANLDIVIDCADPPALAEFWAEALDYKNAGQYEQYVILLPREPGHPPVLLQGVPEPKLAKCRVHIDIRAGDVGAEARRLEVLGASRIDIGQGEQDWITMADPEGNDFCVCPGIPLPDISGSPST